MDSYESNVATRSQSLERVLVLGVVPSLTWAVTRSLARAGTRPVVLGWHRISPFACIGDCARYIPMRGVRWVGGELDAELIEQVDEACASNNLKTVVPADYDATLLLSREGHRLRYARSSAVPSPENIRTLHDKWQLSRVKRFEQGSDVIRFLLFKDEAGCIIL